MQPPPDSLVMQPPPEGFRPNMPTDEAVRGTHMDAALAKVSCAQLGYFEDRWTEQLLRSSRPPRISPLIHRGYYSRVAAIRATVARFLQSCPAGKGAQIVVLGAGFDTLYFWLRDSPERWRSDLVVFEVDFPEVLSRKLSAILRRQGLWPQLDATSQEDIVAAELSVACTRELRTEHLRYVSADMRLPSELNQAMSSAGFRPDVPTLFVAECVLSYMQAMHGDAIVEWAGSAVPAAPSALIVYEQFNPNDRFGKVMVDNLAQRGCPLLSIHEYPTLEDQRERYLSRGWERAAVWDMNTVYSRYLDQADVERIHKLELLDEFEEWHLIQGHYFLLVASRAPGAAAAPPAPVSEAEPEASEAADSAGAAAPADEAWVHTVCGALGSEPSEAS